MTVITTQVVSSVAGTVKATSCICAITITTVVTGAFVYIAAGSAAATVSIIALAGETTSVVSTGGIGVAVVGTCGALVEVALFSVATVVLSSVACAVVCSGSGHFTSGFCVASVVIFVYTVVEVGTCEVQS